MEYHPSTIGRISLSKCCKYLLVFATLYYCTPWASLNPLFGNALLGCAALFIWLKRKQEEETFLWHVSVFGECGWRGKMFVGVFWLCVSCLAGLFSQILFATSALHASVVASVLFLVSLSNASFKASYLRWKRGANYLDQPTNREQSLKPEVSV